MSEDMDSQRLEKISAFEDRMGVVQRDNPQLAEACRNVRAQLDLARAVTESVFNNDVASDVQAVLSVHACIADELEDIRGGGEDDEDEEDE